MQLDLFGGPDEDIKNRVKKGFSTVCFCQDNKMLKTFKDVERVHKETKIPIHTIACNIYDLRSISNTKI